ncbi:transposase [Streptomyces sp. UNOC14_S4]|uniref:IS701 family transposase n=1 Tax=Streptomyces sp. UNOC14_S4 TaxID=2872340 RepID=UPI001E3167FB|nr:transposase [Streptomyces sp. UNOC14_S4]MCC3770840.1 transposase [Streptomyces sp. UNOC14_S4]
MKWRELTAEGVSARPAHRREPTAEEPSSEPDHRAAAARVLQELGPCLFASLPRIDQRHKAGQYVQGLLAAEGRKTLRNIAAQLGGEAAQQSVHHFISGSSWEWEPVRQSLGRSAERLVGPQAWVVRSTLIPRSGAQAAGVARHFLPHLGRTAKAQQALGAWLTSERAAVPVDWRLVLPRSWRDDPGRRARANLPADVKVSTAGEYVRDSVPGAVGSWALPRLPVVLDVPQLCPYELVSGRDGTGRPLIMSVCPDTVLTLDEAVLPGAGTQEMPAWRIVDSMKRLWHRTKVPGPGGGGVEGMLAAVPVKAWVADCAGDGPPFLRALLLAEWSAADRRPTWFWLTEATDVPPAHLLRLTRLSGTVTREFTEVSERVGMRDFAGRSFQGWHRHMTLASVAHLAMATAAARHRAAAHGPLSGVA